VAERKTTNRSSKTPPKNQNAPRKISAAVLFWLVFIIVIAVLFFANREPIAQNIKNTGIFDKFLNREPSQTQTPAEPVMEIIEKPSEDTPPVISENSPAETPESPVKENPADIPSSTVPEISNPELPANVPESPPQENRPETRNRSLYFMRLDSDGTIVRTQVSRDLPLSNSPMIDVLHALLAGPNTDERKNNLESLIPEGTEILSATVRGSTAYINFSEDFQFNIYGAEGYSAQLRQIVWTVTEFSNVIDVQILVEGRRIDYLSEGIWIGSPLNRETL
jgi:spore germination protein GerM